MSAPQQQNTADGPMKWSWKIAELAGIGIHVHWTFLLLIVWIIMMYLSHGEGGWPSALHGVGLVLAVFGCVVLHELGHALTARRFHVQTRDITLLPIGGIARLEKMPEDPKQEFLVTLAGPAVNVVIAAVLFALVWILGSVEPLEKVFSVTGSFLIQLAVVNVMLVIFNVLPAFPMDGGRALRALLATQMDYVSATEFAARTGQLMAILLGIIGIMTNHLVLILIAVFVFFGALTEAHGVQVRFALRNVPVSKAMLTNVIVLASDDTLKAAVDALLDGSQQDFPVVEDERLVGILQRQDLIRALSEHGTAKPVGEVMQRDCRTIEASAKLDEVINQIQSGPCPVLREGKLVGLLTLENIGEWMMVRSALRQRKTGTLP